MSPPTSIFLATRSSSSSLTPTTAGLPNWRATRAAWLVRPPLLVRIPSAAIMPCTSSGLVSGRTMITFFSSCFAQRSAVSASNATIPTAAPRETFRPEAIFFASLIALESNCGWRKKSTCSGLTRWTASLREINPSSTISTAIRTSAWAVRFPSRVWSTHKVPRSMVNSMSCMLR